MCEGKFFQDRSDKKVNGNSTGVECGVWSGGECCWVQRQSVYEHGVLRCVCWSEPSQQTVGMRCGKKYGKKIAVGKNFRKRAEEKNKRNRRGGDGKVFMCG